MEQGRQCCRTCLSTNALKPIFNNIDNEVIKKLMLNITGSEIKLNDGFPQVMCHNCVCFVQEYVKFHEKCVYAYAILTRNIKIKMDTSNLNCNETKSVFFNTNKDYTDGETDFDVTLHKTRDAVSHNIKLMEFEGEIQDILNKNADIVFDNKIKYKKASLNYNDTDEGNTKKNEYKSDAITNVTDNIECQYCNKIFKTKLSLLTHHKVHTGLNIICEHCGKRFLNKRRLMMHCKARHGYEKTDKCSYCDYRASNAELVKIHERTHTGERPYVCAECGASFHRRSSFLQHTPIHLPHKTVQCDQCPARFKSVTLMRIHKNRHRAPRYTFTCRVCNNAFARCRNVARHLQRVHGLQPDPAHIQRAKIG